MNTTNNDYQEKLTAALDARLLWLKTSELPKLKEEVLAFQTAFSTMYTHLLRRGAVSEDPYKREVKVGEIQIPETKTFAESQKQEQISARLASYSKQLDLLAHAYQFNMEFFTLERIRRVWDLISYINWGRLSVDAEDINTRTVAQLLATERHNGDRTVQSVISGTLGSLTKMTVAINKHLNILQKYNREAYKLELRKSVLVNMEEAPTLNFIKQKVATALPKSLFYAELVEEVLKEDYSPEGSVAQAEVLDKLKIVPEEKPKPPKEVDFKAILLEGIQAIGSIASTLSEIWLKFEENHHALEKQKRSVREKIRQFLVRLFHLKTNEESIYELKYVDNDSGILIRDQVNFQKFMLDLEASAKNCSSIVRITGTQIEPLLFETLDQLIADMEKRYKILVGLDDYFKAQIKTDASSRVRGVKPELSTIKNALVKANQQRFEYLDEKQKNFRFKPKVRH